MRTATLALLACLTGMAARAQEPIARAQWLADFEQLETAITSGYPNLEWAVERGMDLSKLDRDTRSRLALVSSEGDARAELARFVNAFGDGHLRLNWPMPGPAVVQPTAVCDRLGYRTDPDSSAIARNLHGYEALGGADATIAAGVVEMGARRLGVLRIASFMPGAALCARAARELGLDAQQCDAQCSEALEQHADALFLREIADAIARLVAAKPTLVLVDLAGNGGGNDSAIATARMLTSVPLTTPRARFVRGAARVADLTDAAKRLRAARAHASAQERALLSGWIAQLDADAHAAAQPCDLAPLWRGEPASCSNLVGAQFAGGLVDAELPAGLRKRRWASAVSTTARYEYTPGLWTGPLWLLVDGRSASATELMAAMLSDAGAARVIGAPTRGSGCGWTLGDHPTVLEHSRGELHMPDCARLPRDGTNEVDGIQPDVMIGFRAFDTAKQRAARLAQALRSQPVP